MKCCHSCSHAVMYGANRVIRCIEGHCAKRDLDVRLREDKKGTVHSYLTQKHATIYLTPEVRMLSCSDYMHSPKAQESADGHLIVLRGLTR